jgi:hypothetical protein
MVIRHYTDYDHPTVCQDEGAVAWFKYKMYRKREHYDSFIMGTSCTKAFNSSEWNKYIHGRPFRLFSNSENVAGAYQKLAALDKQKNQEIRNLLIVCDKSFFINSETREDVTHIMPPDVTGKSRLNFQFTFLQGFFSPEFLWYFLKYHITHHYNDKMRGVINNDGQTHTRYTNDAVLPNEERIKKEGESFWHSDRWKGLLNKYRGHKESPRTIYNTQISFLNGIKNICKRHGTNVKIAIGPSMKRESLNHVDVRILKHIFGTHNVVDYSDAAHSKYYNYHYYYDESHYRTIVGNAMLHDLYSK